VRTTAERGQSKEKARTRRGEFDGMQGTRQLSRLATSRLSGLGNVRRRLDRSQIHIEKLIQLLAVFLVLLSQPHNLSNDFHIEAVALGFLVAAIGPNFHSCKFLSSVSPQTHCEM
jgi:hypothetical protein